MAEQSTASVEHVEGIETVILREPASGSEVHVVAEVGSNVARFRTRIGDQTIDALAAPPDMATLRERPTRWGSAVLFPYPGRIANGRFPFRGRVIELPTDPRDGHAIHGVCRSRPWRVVEAMAAGGAARAVTRFDSAEAGVLAAEWPFPFTITLTTTLRDGILRVATEVVNVGAEPMPMGLGFHPYFPTPLGASGTAGDCEVWVDATERWMQDGPGLPTGEVVQLGPNDGLRQPRRLADVEPTTTMPEGQVRNMLFRRPTIGAPDAAGGIRAGVRDPANGVEVTLAASAGFDRLVFFTPASPAIVALEPQTCVPNAFNIAATTELPSGMIVLDPRATWHGWFDVRARSL